MRVDLIIQPHLPAAEFAALGELAESYGISGVWVSNHLDGRDPFVNFVPLAEDFHAASEQQNREFITAKLWGVADTAPYLHDGRAFTLHEAIMMHGGEAESVRSTYAALSAERKNQILAFLKTLRNPESPNRDVVN